jgi:hypothetical protein
METVWRLSLNPSKVDEVMTEVGNSFHRRIADGKIVVRYFVSSSKVAGTWCHVL